MRNKWFSGFARLRMSVFLQTRGKYPNPISLFDLSPSARSAIGEELRFVARRGGRGDFPTNIVFLHRAVIQPDLRLKRLGAISAVCFLTPNDPCFLHCIIWLNIKQKCLPISKRLSKPPNIMESIGKISAIWSLVMALQTG